MRLIKAKFLGLVRGDLSFLTADGRLLTWYSGRQADYLIPSVTYTVATDGRDAYPPECVN